MFHRILPGTAAGLALAWLLGMTAAAPAQVFNHGCKTCGSCSPVVPGRCPPPFCHYQEGHPRIHIKCACPKPVCPPCDAPNWGYFQPCWRPWPWPPDWTHCPVAVPAAMLPHGPPYQAEGGIYGVPRREQEEQLKIPPRRLNGDGL